MPSWSSREIRPLSSSWTRRTPREMRWKRLSVSTRRSSKRAFSAVMRATCSEISRSRSVIRGGTLVLRSDLPSPAVAGFAKAGALLRRAGRDEGLGTREASRGFLPDAPVSGRRAGSRENLTDRRQRLEGRAEPLGHLVSELRDLGRALSARRTRGLLFAQALEDSGLQGVEPVESRRPAGALPGFDGPARETLRLPAAPARELGARERFGGADRQQGMSDRFGFRERGGEPGNVGRRGARGGGDPGIQNRGAAGALPGQRNGPPGSRPGAFPISPSEARL